MQMKTDWRPVWWGLTWSWILACIPSIVQAIRIGTTQYLVADGALNASSGLVTKRHLSVELYRIKSVSATDNAFSGGKLHLVDQDGTARTFAYVARPEEVVLALRKQIEAAREGKSFAYRESF